MPPTCRVSVKTELEFSFQQDEFCWGSLLWTQGIWLHQSHLIPRSTALVWPLDHHEMAPWITSRPTASHAGSLSVSGIPPPVAARDNSCLQLK